jgi:hypothetical protein
MSKFSQLQNQAGEHSLAEEWSHFARVEMRHGEIVTLLEATAEEERAIMKNAGSARRLTLIPFSGAAKKLAEEKHHAEEELENVRRRLAEEHKVLSDNEQLRHTMMHDWLIQHDPVYRKSGEIERRLNGIRADITTLTGLLVDMRSRYGAANNELAVSFDHRNHTLSDVSLAALEGLMHAYERLDEQQRRFTADIAGLDSLVDGTMYREFKLGSFRPIAPPDCRKGMSYPEMHANFEVGAKEVTQAIDRLSEDFDAAAPTSALMETIRFKYRDSLWKQYLAELNSGEADSMAV